MHDLAYQGHARRYDLSYVDGEIRLHMPTTVANTVCEIIFANKKAYAETAKYFRACGFNLWDFIPPGGAHWGFGGVIHEREIGNEIVWSGCLSNFVQASNHPDLVPGIALSVTFELALQAINTAHVYHNDGRKQLLSVILQASPDKVVNGYQIYAPFSAKLVNLLPELGTELGELERTLHDAWQRMWGASQDPRAFRVCLQSAGRLYVKCPGGAAGLRPMRGSHVSPADEGYDLDGLHVDSPLQQLTLLAGLARLNDLAREHLKR